MSQLGQTCWLPGISMPVIAWGHISSWTWSRFLHRIESNWKKWNFNKKYWSDQKHSFGTVRACGVSASSDIFCATVELKTGVVTAHIDYCMVNCGDLNNINDPPQTWKLHFFIAGHRNLLMGHWAPNIIRLSDFCIQHCVYENRVEEVELLCLNFFLPFLFIML
jgi:hypothetical protein